MEANHTHLGGLSARQRRSIERDVVRRLVKAWGSQQELSEVVMARHPGMKLDPSALSKKLRGAYAFQEGEVDAILGVIGVQREQFDEEMERVAASPQFRTLPIFRISNETSFMVPSRTREGTMAVIDRDGGVEQLDAFALKVQTGDLSPYVEAGDELVFVPFDMENSLPQQIDAGELCLVVESSGVARMGYATIDAKRIRLRFASPAADDVFIPLERVSRLATFIQHRSGRRPGPR